MKKVVIAITGGGSAAISTILEAGGASAWLLEATVPYSQKSIDEFVKGVREKYASESTARQMAVAAYHRAQQLDAEAEGWIGAAMTCSLPRIEGEREGRNHFICAAFFDGENISIIKREGPIANRDLGEKLATTCFLGSLDMIQTQGFLRPNPPVPWQIDNASWDYSKKFVRLLNGVETPLDEDDQVIFSGSFNPLHDGHKYIQETTEKLYGRCAYELSIFNFEKPMLDPIEIRNRVAQFEDKDLYVTSFPRFFMKTAYLKGANDKRGITYAIGVDTYDRLDDVDLDANVKYLVFPREGDRVESRYNGGVPEHVLLETLKLEEGPSFKSRDIRNGKA